MPSVSILSGTILRLPEITVMPDSIDEFSITITSVDPFGIVCVFDKDEYRRKHAAGDRQTPLDIDCRRQGADPEGSNVTATIKLHSSLKNVAFIEQDGLAITAGSPDALKILCNLTVVSPSEVSFVIVRAADAKGLLPYNLGLVFTDPKDPTYHLPVIYDPKVQNDS